MCKKHVVCYSACRHSETATDVCARAPTERRSRATCNKTTSRRDVSQGFCNNCTRLLAIKKKDSHQSARRQ